MTRLPVPSRSTSVRTYSPGGTRRWLAAPEGYRSPGSRSALAQGALALVAVTSVLLVFNVDSAVGVAAGRAGAEIEAGELVIRWPLAGQALMGSLFLQTAAVVVSALTFTLWLRRLLANLATLVEHSVRPMRGTAYCLLPLVNLVMLPRVLQGLRAENGALFYAWWALWVVSELTLFGLLGAAVVADGFFTSTQEIAWTPVLGTDPNRAGLVTMLNAVVVAAGAVATIAIVRETTRQHEIGENTDD